MNAILGTFRLLLCSGLVLLTAGALFSIPQGDTTKAKSKKVTNEFKLVTGAPVIIDSDTLFFIKYSEPKQSAQVKAGRLSGKLIALRDVFKPFRDSLTVLGDSTLSSVFYNENILFNISAKEAYHHGTSPELLAEEWKEIIEKKFRNQLGQEETMVQYLISAGIIIAALLLMHFFLRFLFRRLNKYIASKQSQYLKGIKIRDFELMDSDDQLEAIYKITWLIRVILLLILAYLVFPVIFSLFPATEPIAFQLLGFVADPALGILHGFLNYLPKLFTIIVIIWVVRFILKYLKSLAKRIEYGRIKISGFFPDWASTTYFLVRIMIIALALVMIFPYLPGAQSDVFKGVSVFIGVIFSLGSTTVVGNLVSGLVITYMRPFKMGDRIRIGEVEGEILQKTAFVLRLKTSKNEYITIPNSNVLASHITNYNRSISEGGVLLYREVTIGYDVPWREVHELLINAALKIEYLEQEPKPFVLQKALGDFSVCYQINAYCKKPLYKDLIYSLLHQEIQDAFKEANIEILSPNYMATRDGSGSTVPKK
jgi:small-conductance mechanosensitive channel